MNPAASSPSRRFRFRRFVRAAFRRLSSFAAVALACGADLYGDDLARGEGENPHAESAELNPHAESAENAEPESHAESAEFAE